MLFRSYRGVRGERRVVFIHPQDLKDIGMKAGQWVDIQSVHPDGQSRRAERFVLVAYDIPRGCLASYFPETNALVPLSSVAIGAGTPTSKSIPVLLSLRPQDAPLAQASADRIRVWVQGTEQRAVPSGNWLGIWGKN